MFVSISQAERGEYTSATRCILRGIRDHDEPSFRSMAQPSDVMASDRRGIFDIFHPYVQTNTFYILFIPILR